MPNCWYESGRTAVLKGADANSTQLGLGTDTIKLLLLDLDAYVGGGPPTVGVAVTGATNATPIVVTGTAHGFANGDFVAINGVLGNLAANGVFKIANVAANTFELTDPNTGNPIAGTGGYTSGGHATNLSSHKFVDKIPGAAIVARSAALSSKTFDVPRGGVLDAADTVFSSVSGSVSEAVAAYKDTGADGTSPLLFYITDATGLPITPNGTNETVIWDNGALRILMI